MSKAYASSFIDVPISALGVIELNDQTIWISSPIVNPKNANTLGERVEGPIAGLTHMYRLAAEYNGAQYGLCIPRVTIALTRIKFGGFFFGVETEHADYPIYQGLQDLNNFGGQRSKAKLNLLDVTKEQAIADFRDFTKHSDRDSILDRSLEILFADGDFYLLLAKNVDCDVLHKYLMIELLENDIRIIGRATASRRFDESLVQHVYWELPKIEIERLEIFSFINRNFLALSMSNVLRSV